MPRPWRYPDGRGYWWFDRSLISQFVPGHRYLTGPGPGWGLSHGRIQRTEGTGVSVGPYIRPVRWSGIRCPGEYRVRRESGASDVTDRPLFSLSIASASQERHLHSVRLERYSGVTRIVALAELPRLGVLFVLIYRPRRVG